MVKFERSFNELKKPILWVHYALGTLFIYLIYNFVLKQVEEAPIREIMIAIITFYIIYIFVDRFVHGLLELF